jgi:hypothetical protein
MIIGDFHFMRAILPPNETDSVLVVNADTMLSFAIAL